MGGPHRENKFCEHCGSLGSLALANDRHDFLCCYTVLSLVSSAFSRIECTEAVIGLSTEMQTPESRRVGCG